MTFKDFARNTRQWIVNKEPTSGFSRLMVLFSYKSALIFFGKYGKRKQSAIEVIEENAAPEHLANKKKVRFLLNEIFFCRFMYGIAAKEYFVYDFEKLSHEGRKEFVTRGNKYPYYKKLNNQNYTSYFNMKTETYRKFKDFYGREVLCMYDHDDIEAFREFVKRHPRFIYKPADDYGGNGIHIYNSEEYKSVDELFEILIFGGFCVVEELIVQHEAIAKLHPASVNTVRVVAFLKEDKDIDIQWCFLRMGMGGSHTDNMSSGGLASMVDPKTGIMYATGRDWLGEEHIFHPDTGVKLVGYQLPEWDKLLELVKNLAQVIPEVRLVGWDLSYTTKGWVFVEGNARPQCVSAQISKYNGKLHLFKNMDMMIENERK